MAAPGSHWAKIRNAHAFPLFLAIFGNVMPVIATKKYLFGSVTDPGPQKAAIC
jgi:hypothetical protein